MMSCRLIHCSQTLCIQLSVVQFFLVNLSKTSKLTLFTKFIIIIFTFNLFNSFNKPTLKNKYKMKNINEFCDKFMRILQYFIVCYVNDKMMCLFFTNNIIHLIIHSNIFFFKNYAIIVHDWSLKIREQHSCLTTSRFCHFSCFKLYEFVW